MDYDILLSPRATLKGKVVDTSYNPIPGAKLTANGTVGIDGKSYASAADLTTRSNAEGEFAISGMPEGTAKIRCRSEAMSQQTSSQKNFRVTNNKWEHTDDVIIIMAGTGTVRGVVTGKKGETPTRTFMVELEPKGGSRIGKWSGSSNCKKDGSFEFSGIPEGEYVLYARPNPGSEKEKSKMFDITITTGAMLNLEIETEFAHKQKR